MSDSRNNGIKKNKVGVWLIVGVLILIALLLVWLTVADLFGATDVAAQLLDLTSSTTSSVILPVV